MNKVIKIGTHNGVFHADDVFGIALLKLFLDSEVEVIRSRDKKLLDTCDILVDIGGEYSISKMRFDHHQDDYGGTLSSAGMVLDAITQFRKESQDTCDTSFVSDNIRSLIREIDLHDNGIEKSSNPVIEYIKYSNPLDASKSDEAFEKVLQKIIFYIQGYISDSDIESELDTLKMEAKKRERKDKETLASLLFTEDVNGLIELPRFIPNWSKVINGLSNPNARWVRFWDNTQDCWTYQVVPTEPGGFEFPQENNLNIDENKKILSLGEIIFTHKNGFVAKVRGLKK